MTSTLPVRTPGFATGLSLLIPITLSTMAIVLLAPILPQILDEFKTVPHFEYWVPMVLTIPALCVAVLSPFAGILGDYFGRRKLLIAAFAVYAVVGLAPIFLKDLTAILISRVGVGISEALIMVLSTTMIGDYFKGTARDKWLAGQTACASMSALLFFNLGGLLGSHGWRTPFWVYASALVMMAAVIACTWEPGRDGSVAASDSAPHNASWAEFPWLRMMIIIGITIYGSVFFYTVQIQASSGLVAHGLTNPARIGFLTSIASIGVPLGTFIYSRVSQAPIGKLLLVEFAMLATGFMLMSRMGSVNGFLVGCFINQVGAGLLLPSLLVWSMSILDFNVRSRGTGMWQAAFSLGQFLCPIIITFISARAGGLLASFSFLSVGAMAGAIVAAVLLMKRQPAHV
jgi:MFS family permease